MLRSPSTSPRGATAAPPGHPSAGPREVEGRIAALLARMTPAEKVGQLNQVSGPVPGPDALAGRVRGGEIGAVLNVVDVATVNELQRIAVEESRLGIPLLFGRDVIHGFKTVFPIPLGQAATFDPSAVQDAARISAVEAAASGVRWTFAPMMDIGRDPRWGRVAESLGEDPWLSGVLAGAMVRGFQGDDLRSPDSLAACAKHFVGYGACEAGRDYDTTNISERELRDVHLPPFRAALRAGLSTVMTSFSDLDGVPATANQRLITGVLRDEWGFDGVVVSDWESIRELIVHGIAEDGRDAARQAARAGVDMDMASGLFAEHLAQLVDEGLVAGDRLDEMVAAVLRLKFRLGLFEQSSTNPDAFAPPGSPAHLEAAQRVAARSLVLLKNEGPVLPLQADRLRSVAVIGPMADDGIEQLGTWVFDGDPGLSRTPVTALRHALGDGVGIVHVPALDTTRSHDTAGFAEAQAAAAAADVALLVLGEESVLSGEAHSRADIRLPGAQEALIREVAATGTPVVLVVMAGRPLALGDVVDHVDALVYAWHPGSMGGPAIADVLLGNRDPVGRLPVTMPRVSGQVPIHYARKNSGRPPSPEGFIHMDALPKHASQNSSGHACFHLDAGYTPLFPFGFGLSYTRFEYRDILVETEAVPLGGTIRVHATVANVGERPGEDVAQLYVRDLVGSVTRPVRELKGFQRVRLEAGQECRVTFDLHTDDLAFAGLDMRTTTEPGWFHVWIGSDSNATLRSAFQVVQP